MQLALPEDRTGHDWGGRLCFAVVNSVLWRRSATPDDLLTDYQALVRQVDLAHALPDATGLLDSAAADPAAARRALVAGVGLREVLFDLFSAVAAGEPAQPADLVALNTELAEALQQLALADGHRLGWPRNLSLDLPRWQVAVSAAAVLSADDPTRIKQCPGERCGWVFLDASRNRSRRWCEPNECGNRERVRAYYRRSRTGL